LKTTITASQQSEKTRKLVYLSFLSAIILVLQFTPLGYIPIPGFNPTTLHIPVIIGAILMGPAEGAFLGFVFGITSIIQATLILPLTAFLFSPFVPFGSYKSVIIAIVPRVLLGIVAGYTFRLISRFDKSSVIASVIAATLGSLTNTVLVLGGAYLLFKDLLAKNVFNVSASALLTALLAIVATSGIAEIIAAAVIATGIVSAMFAVTKYSRNKKI